MHPKFTTALVLTLVTLFKSCLGLLVTIDVSPSVLNVLFILVVNNKPETSSSTYGEIDYIMDHDFVA